MTTATGHAVSHPAFHEPEHVFVDLLDQKMVEGEFALVEIFIGLMLSVPPARHESPARTPG